MRPHTAEKLSAIFLLCVVVSLGSDPSGRWTGEMTLTVPRVQSRTFTMELKMEGSRVVGKIGRGRDQADVLDGRIVDDELTFGVATGAVDMPRFEFKVKIEAETFKFTISGLDPSGTLQKLGDGSAKRVP